MATKVAQLTCYLLFRLLLPLILLGAVVLRYNGLSFVYAICLLLAPLLPPPTEITIRSITGRYLKALIGISSIGILAHAIFHITLASIQTDTEPYGSLFPNCSTNEQIARQFGLERLDGVPVVEIIRLVLPEVVIFIVSLLVLIVSLKLLKTELPQDSSEVSSSKPRRKNVSSILDFIGEFLVALLLAASGIILPTVIASIYFLSFLYIATWWAFYKCLGRKFRGFRIFLLIYCAIHILVLYLYQFQFFQDFLPPDHFIARLVGLTGVIRTDCSKPYTLELHSDIDWPVFVNPGILLLLYWVLAFETRRWCQQKASVENVDETVPVKERTKKRRKRYKAPTERQVLPQHQQEQAECLVGEDEAQNYSSMGVNAADDIPTPTMSADESEEDEADGSGKKNNKPNVKRSPLVSVFVYVMKQSYVLALIAMMAWSIAYHSWLTFVLLLSACFIWMVPRSRHACLVSSPVIVIYAEILLGIQYVYGMNLVELPDEIGEVNMKEIGFQKFAYPCLQLALQWFKAVNTSVHPDSLIDGCIFSIFWNSEQDRILYESLPTDRDLVDGYDSRAMQNMGSYFWSLLCKYWIFVCAIMLMVISLQEVVMYRIVYMFLFLFFVLTFQLSYGFWRVTMFLFWWIVIIYSMAVLIMLYTFQFSKFPEYWHMGTGLTKPDIMFCRLADMGLEQFDTAGLFIKLLTPTSFVIVIIIQVHYFHTPFLRMSALDRHRRAETEPKMFTEETSPDDTDGLTTDTDGEIVKRQKPLRHALKCKIRKLWISASKLWASVATFLWRLSEIHVFKVVALTIILVSTAEVSAISAVYVLVLVIFLPLTRCHVCLSHIAQVWTALVLLAKMIFQLRLVDTDYWFSNCTVLNGTSNLPISPFNETIDNALWTGLEKTTDIAYYVRNYIAILIVIALESIIRYRQRQYFDQLGVKRPNTGVIFPQINRNDADRGLRTCVMFLSNFFFCKFGLELCYIMSAVAICIRVDAVAVLYAIFLGILLFMSRRGNARIWPLYVLVLAILLPLQYFSALGFPLGLCIEYPWDAMHGFNRNLEHWLYLADYTYAPDAYKLVADFFQLLFVCLQWRVFRMEMRSKKEDLQWGDNEDILCEVEANQEIPVDDFTSENESLFFFIKGIQKAGNFRYSFWCEKCRIFCSRSEMMRKMDYICISLTLYCRWNFLLCYCFFVLLIKAALQLLGCVYVDHLYDNYCWVIQLLGLTCLQPSPQYAPGTETGSCEVEEDNTGLSWDVVCFAFLLLQRRIYSSHYFRHIVATLEAQNRLASRGAELINRVLVHEVQEQNQHETVIITNIKKKMNYLKERQRKLKKDFVEPEEHFQAIRAGDYYLFEEDSVSEEIGEADPDTLTLGTDKDDDKDTKNPLHYSFLTSKPKPNLLLDHISGFTENLQGSSSVQDEVDGPEGDHTKDGCEEEETGSKISNFLQLVVKVFTSFIDSVIELFDRISCNYRLVATKLEEEMKTMKAKISVSSYESTTIITILSQYVGKKNFSGKKEQNFTPPYEIVNIDLIYQVLFGSLAIDAEKTDQEVKFVESQPRIYRLLAATYYVLIARSELVCFFLMILNQILCASLLSLPLPLMVFLWGMLSVPRTAKTFWITAITYTEAMIVVKYLFQFSFFPWNTSGFHEGPFWPPRILGIEKKDNYVTADLILLIALFIHRSILKRYGLWRDEEGISTDLVKAEEKEQRRSQSEQYPSIESGEGAQSSASIHASQELEDSTEKKSKFNIGQLIQPFRDFYKQLTNPDYNATADVYAPMFACDFINFLIIVFGYWAFGPAESAGGGDVGSYISENRVPVVFLVMLVAMFVLIIIDRALYLRKNILGKFFFQIILVSVIHIWMFFILPYSSKRSFTDNVPAQLFYFVKCVYFGLSAYQIRSGYPTRILGNFLTKKYNYLNLILFKGFLAIPFLLELRSLMDWMWTDTTLSVGSWLQMEDIYSNIYLLKCWRTAEGKYPTQRGNKKKAVIKYGLGGILLFVIIFIIWFPLVIFSFANTVFVANPPVECSVSIAVGGYEPLFRMTTQTQGISQLESAEFERLKSFYMKDMSAVGFMSTYEAEDVTMVKLNGQSSSVWGISPPSEKALAEALRNSSNMNLEFSLSLSRGIVAGTNAETLSNLFILTIPQNTRTAMANVIESNTTESVTVLSLFPRFIRLGGQGKANPIEQLMRGLGKSNVSFTLNHEDDTSWWQTQEIVQGDILKPDFKVKNHTDNSLYILTFNDRAAPAGFSFITGYGIIGLYLSFILLIGRILRLSTTGLLDGISFKELPYVDNVLQLCLDLYMVREMKEFRLEEDLYAKLIFVYRSAETRIKWTRIIGLYFSLVFVVGRFVRIFFSGQSYRVMFEELPNVEKIHQLCMDIYLVREIKDYYLEEELFSKLLFLYRSPEIMIKWTKYKQS
ncbi:hypothetical protein ScPMuIL_000841 [Solemya velum]